MSSDGTKNAQNLAELEISAIMSSETGRNFAWSILQGTGVFTDTFDPDPISHAFNAGMRRVGLNLISEIKAVEPDNYMRMLKEHEHE